LWFAVPDEEDSNKMWANEEIVAQLVSMGFNDLHCQKAAINTSNVGVEEAMNWLLSHMDDPGIWFFFFFFCRTIFFAGHLAVLDLMLDKFVLHRYWPSYIQRSWLWNFDSHRPIKSWYSNFIWISRRNC